MRIAYLARSRIPSRQANSVHVMRMCGAFAACGHEVTLVARDGGAPAAEVHRWYGVDPTFAVHRITGPELRLVNAGVVALRARRFLRRHGPFDLVYARDRQALALWLRTSREHAPVVFEVHAPPPNRLVGLVEQSIFGHRAFTRLVVISAALRDEYLRRFPRLDPAQVVVAPDAGPVIDDAAAGPPPVGVASPAVGYVGHLYAGRGIDLVLAVARGLPRVGVHIVGGEPDDVARWRAEAPPNVTFHGHVAPAVVPALLGRFDVLLAPYQRRVSVAASRADTARWMSPLKIFEYMGSGRPMVASDLPVLREVLVHGENAWLCDPGDPEQWVHAVRTLLADERSARAIGARARADFLARYTWERRAESVLAGIDC